MTRTNRALNSAVNVAEKAAVGLFRWVATDHINKGRPIQFIPGTTFLGSLGYAYQFHPASSTHINLAHTPQPSP